MSDGLNFYEIMMGVLYSLGGFLSLGVVLSIVLHYVRKNKKIKTKDFVVLEPIKEEFVQGEFDLLFETFTNKEILLELTDFDGNVVSELAKGEYEEGIHRIKFNSNDFPNETYFYKLTTDNQVINKKLKIKNNS